MQLFQQALQGIDFNQRHIAVQDQYVFGFDKWHSLRNRVASTQLLVLQNKIQIIRSQSLAHRFSTVANHHVNALWIKLPGAVDNMAEHRITGNWVQNLRQCRTHACALTGSKDYDF